MKTIDALALNMLFFFFSSLGGAAAESEVESSFELTPEQKARMEAYQKSLSDEEKRESALVQEELSYLMNDTLENTINALYTQKLNHAQIYRLIEQLEKLNAPTIIAQLYKKYPFLTIRLFQYKGKPLFIAVWNDAATQDTKNEAISYLFSNITDQCYTDINNCFKLLNDAAKFFKQIKNQLGTYMRDRVKDKLNEWQERYHIIGN